MTSIEEIRIARLLRALDRSRGNKTRRRAIKAALFRIIYGGERGWSK